MLTFLEKYGGNVHSQNGEDLAIQECVRRIPDLNRVCVEVGSNDGMWLSNTRHLIEQGWTGLFVEADYSLYFKCKSNWAHNPRVRSQCSRVDGKNINAFVDDSCDLASFDTDGADYRIFQGLKAKPKIVIIEIDSSIPPQIKSYFNKDGAGTYHNTVELGISKGYFLLCHTGNLIMVASEYRELFPEIEGDGLSNSHLYFNNAWVMEGVT